MQRLCVLAFFAEDFVQRLGWLTDQQIVDAVAWPVTPGPVVYHRDVHLLPGRRLARGDRRDRGVFLPSFCSSPSSIRLCPAAQVAVDQRVARWRQRAAVGLMISVLQLG